MRWLSRRWTATSVLLLLTARLACADITTGLVAWWKLDDGSGTTAVDDMTTHPLTWTGTAGWLSGASCQLGGCATFDGAPSYLRKTAPVLGTDASVSLAFYVYYSTAGLSRWIYTEGHSTSGRTFGLATDASDRLYAEVRQSNASLITITGTGALALNAWNCVVFTVDSSVPNVKLYLASALDTTDTAWNGTVSATTADRSTIGAGHNASSPWIGRIDEGRLFSRVLTLTDVGEYCAFTGVAGTPVGGKRQYRLE